MRRPKGIGTVWRSKRFYHGPRKLSPRRFRKKFYIVKQPWAKRRGLKIPKGIPRASRVKVGTLRKTRKLAIQSFITPIRGHAFILPHRRDGRLIGGYIKRK